MPTATDRMTKEEIAACPTLREYLVAQFGPSAGNIDFSSSIRALDYRVKGMHIVAHIGGQTFVSCGGTVILSFQIAESFPTTHALYLVLDRGTLRIVESA